MELTEEQIKELNGIMYLSVEDTKSQKYSAERRVVHFISTPHIDKMRDIMIPEGMDSTEFDLTKTVFKNHQYDKEIGSNVKLTRIKGEGVKATTYITDKTQTGIDAYNLIMDDVIKGWSIGFSPVRDHTGRIKEGTIEYDEKKGTRIFKEWKLGEYSLTGIPMNPNALTTAKSICKSADFKTEIEYLENILQVNTTLESFKQELAEIKSLNESLKTGAYNDTELRNEITELKSQLVKLIGNENEKVSLDLVRKQVRQSLVGSFNEFTGYNLKIK